jgi:DNA processing protein
MNDFDFWFSMVELSPKIKLNILKKFKITEKIWYYSINKKNHNCFSNFKVIKALEKAWDKKKISEIKNVMKDKKINLISFFDETYPEKLKYFDDAPSILFYRGDINKLNDNINVSIVGSRKCSYYGENVAELISKELALNNINVISGMARGIDSIAHNSTLKNLGFTCAILGCGVDVVYPRENNKLYEQIIDKGCIISEFPPGTPPYALNFPIRNRIISALSEVIVVVEADLKSGTLITANYALNQGKDVMAVPGQVFSSISRGTNKLIKDGAFPFTQIEDLFELLGIERQNKKKFVKKNTNSKKGKIVDIITDNPMHIDDIIKLTNIDITCLYGLLFEMQLDNEIKCLAGNYYVKINKSI